MGHVLEFDKKRYIAAARVLTFPLREYNDVLIKLIELNGYVSLTELSCTYGVARSIRGAAATCAGLAERNLITRDLDALYPSHRSHPAVYQIAYGRIEEEALNPTTASDEQEHYIYLHQQRKTLMNYDNQSSINGKYAAQFRKDAAETKNKNGQNIVSHTSLLEPGRNAANVRRSADMYEQWDAEECPVHSRVNRDCEG